MADGSLKFDTKIDTSGFEKGANTLKGIMNRAVQVIKNTGNQATGAFTGAETGIRALVSEIDRYRDGLYYLEKQGYYFGDREYDEAYAHLARLESQLNQYKKSLAGADSQQKKAATSTRKLGKEVDKTDKKTSRFGKTLRLLKRALLFSVVFKALNASMRAISEGFENLAQYSVQTNKDISTLKTSMQTLKNSLATAFAPVLTAITPALQTLINTLSEAITTLGQFFAALLTGAKTFTKAKDAQIDYAKSIAKTAKEANKALSPIDKLNVVTDAQTGGYEAPGPQQMFEEIKIDEGLLNKVERFKDLLQPAIDAFDRLKEAAAPFAENVGEGLKWFYDNVLVPLGTWTITELIPNFLDMLGAAIGVLNSLLPIFQPLGQWLWENFLQPLAAWVGDAVINGLQSITSGLQSLSDWISNNQELVANAALLIGSFFLAFKFVEFAAAVVPFISTLGSMISSGTLLSTVLSGISSVLGAIFGPVGIAVGALGLLIYSFIDLYRNSEEFRQSLANMQQTWMEALQPLADFVSGALTSAWNDILKPVIQFFVDTLLPNLIDIFKNLWKKVLVPLGDFLGKVLQPVFKILSEILSMLWENVILPLADAIGNVLKKAWDGIYQILKKTVIPIIEKVIEVLKFLWEKVINPIIKVLWDVLKPAFEDVFKAIGGLFDGFGKALGGIIDFVTGVFTGDWKKAWEGIKDIFSGIWDGIWSVIKGVINLIIGLINGLISGITSGINAVIRALNAIQITVPDWVPLLGGKKFGFNLKELKAPQIPKLATGTVVPANYGEFLAILGDNRREPEVVSPISAIEQAVENVLNRMGGAGTGTINLNVYLSGKQIHSEVVRVDQEYRAQTGKSAFAY